MHHSKVLAVTFAVSTAVSTVGISSCTEHPTAHDQRAADGQGIATTSSVLAEALLIHDRSMSGTRLIDFVDAKFQHHLVLDLNGNPFQDLVVATNVAYAPDEAYNRCPSGEITAAIGATKNQLPLNWSMCGAALTNKIVDLIGRVGDDFAAIVAADASSYLISTHSGAYFDVANGEQLSPEQIDQLKRAYSEAWTAAQDNGVLAEVQAAWTTLDVPPEDQARLTRADGAFDVEAAMAFDEGPSLLELVRDLGTSDPGDVGDPGRSASDPQFRSFSTWNGTCYRYWFFGWHSLGCDSYEQGQLNNPSRMQAHYPDQGSGFTVPKCYAPGTETNVAGCGPAAFGSLAEWLWRQGTPISGAPLSRGNESHLWFDTNAQLPFYRSVESQTIGLMAACGLGGSGTLTLPAGFVAGGNLWLAMHAPGTAMDSRSSSFTANAFAGGTYRGVLRNQIGYDRGPVVAGFHIAGGGAFEYHYSVVSSYFIGVPRFGLISAKIDTIDGYSGVLTNPWSLFSGVYWLTGNIGGCVFGDAKLATSCYGNVPGYTCMQALEPSDPHTWNDNYICWKGSQGPLSWSYAGPIAGRVCNQTNEMADPHTWTDNYICSLNAASQVWFSTSWTNASNCVRWREPSDPHTWDDNFLCHN